MIRMLSEKPTRTVILEHVLETKVLLINCSLVQHTQSFSFARKLLFLLKIGRMGLGSNPLDIRPIMQLGIFKRRLEVNNIGMQLFIVENKNSKVLRHYFPRTFCER